MQYLKVKELYLTGTVTDEKMKLISEGNIPVVDDIPMIRKDGSLFFAEITATPITLNGELFMLNSFRDITERKQMQQKILRAIIETEENERKRVAQELHDGIGPVLSTIKLFTETYLNSKDEEFKKKISSQLLSGINDALEQVSIISNNLSPHILTDFGLKVAINKFIDKLSEISLLNISFNYRLNERIKSEIEISIYRVVIEMINNTMKHAQAKHIELIIEEKYGEVIVAYSDDGIGFDFNKSKEERTGMGLFNIQNRIKSLNGEIEFYQNEQYGARYMIKIPL